METIFANLILKVVRPGAGWPPAADQRPPGFSRLVPSRGVDVVKRTLSSRISILSPPDSSGVLRSGTDTEASENPDLRSLNPQIANFFGGDSNTGS